MTPPLFSQVLNDIHATTKCDSSSLRVERGLLATRNSGFDQQQNSGECEFVKRGAREVLTDSVCQCEEERNAATKSLRHIFERRSHGERTTLGGGVGTRDTQNSLGDHKYQ